MGELGGRTGLKGEEEEGKKKKVEKIVELRRKAGRRGKGINEWRKRINYGRCKEGRRK